MRLELAERLCCPSAHAPTPLILVRQLAVERELITGMLGCPVCQLEARIANGDVHFGPMVAVASESESMGAAPVAAVPDIDRVMALLGLAEAGGAVLLTGRYAALGPRLAVRAEVSVVVMGPLRDPPTPNADGAGVSVLYGPLDRLPFTDGTFRGVALDVALPLGLVTEAVRATSLGGRVLAPVAVAPPVGVKELARDDQEWVAAREHSRPMVELTRRQ